MTIILWSTEMHLLFTIFLLTLLRVTPSQVSFGNNSSVGRIHQKSGPWISTRLQKCLMVSLYRKSFDMSCRAKNKKEQKIWRYQSTSCIVETMGAFGSAAKTLITAIHGRLVTETRNARADFFSFRNYHLPSNVAVLQPCCPLFINLLDFIYNK